MEISKDKLNEAFQYARAMGNTFKAFRQAEETIAALIQILDGAEVLRLAAAAAKEEADRVIADAAEHVRRRDQAKAEFDQEVVRLAAYRKEGLERIDEELASAKTQASEKIEASRAAIKAAEDASAEAMEIHEGLLISLHAEIDAKRDVLATLQGEIDALKRKFV